jgi:nitroreductase
MKKYFIGLFLFVLVCAQAQEIKPIKLLPPQTNIGKPLMQAMLLRQTNRNFDNKPLPLQELSNLLWAAAGINRPESGKRTTPSAMNRQEVDVYAFLTEGIFLYNPQAHTLEPVIGKDLRAITTMQPPDKKDSTLTPKKPSALNNAPLVLAFVADEKKLGIGSDIQKVQYSSAAAGFMIQNVYLYCASQGLASVVRASFDGDAMTKELQLRPEQRIVLVQSVGYPK